MLEPILTTTRHAKVNSNLDLISLILNALMIVLNISDHLGFSTKCFNLFLGNCAERIYLNIELLG